MIISDEQARLAAQALRQPAEADPCAHVTVSPELFERVYAAVLQTPETRTERVREAMEYLDAGAPDPREIAGKMISRIISDSLR